MADVSVAVESLLDSVEVHRAFVKVGGSTKEHVLEALRGVIK